MPTYPTLIYRGNFQVVAALDYSNSLLRADFGGGLSETEVIFPPLRDWKLSYPELSRDAMIYLPSGESVSRLDYVWAMYRASKDSGNHPLILRCPRDKKLYLVEFADDRLEYSLADLYLATCGLTLKQVYARGVTFNADGSLPEEVGGS